MINKDTDNKLPIYKLTSKDKVLKYYDDWTKNAQFNQDMIDWEYTAPVNTVQLFDKYILDKNIKILDAGCGSGLAGIELKKRGFTNIYGVDFSQNMLDLVPKDIYRSLNRIDLNKKLFIKRKSIHPIERSSQKHSGRLLAHFGGTLFWTKKSVLEQF